MLESKNSTEIAKRVEIFARARQKVFGILHTFSVAYSAEPKLLELAANSSNVVEVRTIAPLGGSTHYLQDHLILKRFFEEGESQEKTTLPHYTMMPNILVSPLWRERMSLKNGDKVIISQPPEEYSIAPPTV